MSSSFRIAVNLSNFFADHRRQARICVNDSIQTIGDLQNKISGIFDIDGFYLVCDSDFLPPSEDIHVLQNNDLVWAMPDTTVTLQLHNKQSTPLYHRNVSESVKQTMEKNKRKILENGTSYLGTELTEDIPQKKKCRLTEKQFDNNKGIVVSERNNKHKLTANETDSPIKNKSPERKKKKKREILSFGSQNIQEIADTVNNSRDKSFVDKSESTVHKKKKRNLFIGCISDHSIFENSVMDKTGKAKKRNEINFSEHAKPSTSVSDGKKKQENNEIRSPLMNTNCNQMVCKGDLASYTRKQPIPTTTEEYLKEKKINIVRIDYVTTKDTSKCNQSQNLKSIANVPFSNTSKASLLTNTSPIKFAPELTRIEEYKSASSQKCSSNENTGVLNKNEQDMKKSEVPKLENFCKDPPETCNSNETSVTQFVNEMVTNNEKSAQQYNFKLGLESGKNSHIKKTSIPEAKECRIINNLNHDPAECSTDSTVPKEKSGIVGGTKLDILNDNDNPQTLTVDVKTPKNKEWSYKEISPLSESLLAGFTSSVLDSTHSIAVEDVYGKSPLVSGCQWFQSESKTPRPKHKELSGVGQILENLRTAPNGKPQDVLDVDPFVTLRKRKRSRNRPKKNRFLIDDSLMLPPETVPMPKPMITEASPNIHIKFDEDGKEDLINSKRENQKCSGEADTPNDGNHLESFFQIIQKATPMKDMAPKVGDTIAFKVLKMSESYTPEVSGYIMGNVIKYNPSDGSVKFNIIAGLEELKEPNGKLSIVENDDVKQRQHKEFNWTELIEPRLFS